MGNIQHQVQGETELPQLPRCCWWRAMGLQRKAAVPWKPPGPGRDELCWAGRCWLCWALPHKSLLSVEPIIRRLPDYPDKWSVVSWAVLVRVWWESAHHNTNALLGCSFTESQNEEGWKTPQRSSNPTANPSPPLLLTTLPSATSPHFRAGTL